MGKAAMYARILVVGPVPFGEASVNRRLQEALRALGHAVQICKDPAEESYGSRALETALRTFEPTLVLWDPRFDARPFNDSLKAANCLVVRLVDGGGERAVGPFDACVSRPAAVDGRYAEAKISDSNLERSGIVVFGDCPDDELLRMRSAGRVERAVDLAACPWVNMAYELRTFSKAVWLGTSAAPAELALRQAEGLVDRDEQTDERTLEELLPSFLAELDSMAADSGKTPVLQKVEPARVFVVYGWLAAHNFGDDLLLEVVANRIRSHYENAQVFVVGAETHVVRAELGCEGADPHERFVIERVLPWASAVVYLGGLLFDDPMFSTSGSLEFSYDPWIEPSGQAVLSLLASSYGVPSVMLGIGAGPLEQPATKRAVDLLGRAGTLFLARDEQTARALLDAGAPAEKVRAMADLVAGSGAYVASHAGELPGGAPVEGFFTVSLRDWPLCPSDFDEKVARAVDAAIERSGLQALFLPFDVGDVRVHERVVSRMVHAEQAVLLRERPCGPQLLACINASDFALAMRLHCSVLHHVLGKPAIGIDYNAKVGAYFAQVHQEALLLPLGFSDDEAESAIDSVVGDADRLSQEVGQFVCKTSEIVDEEFSMLFDLVDSKPLHASEGPEIYYPRTLDRHEVRAIQLEARVKELEDELRAFQAKNDQEEPGRSLLSSIKRRLRS